VARVLQEEEEEKARSFYVMQCDCEDLGDKEDSAQQQVIKKMFERRHLGSLLFNQKEGTSSNTHCV